MTHPARLSIEHLLKCCSIKTARGSGPGGQHRNKTETAVVVTHESLSISGQASESRSQDTNRELAIHRLRLNLAVHFRGVPDEKPSELWLTRFPKGQIKIAIEHPDFPSILAEALDQFAAQDYRLAETAAALTISSGQFIKLIKRYEPALSACNKERAKLGLHPLT